MDSLAQNVMQFIGKMKSSWSNWTLNQKVISAGGVLLLVSALAVLAIGNSGSRYEVLYTDLSTKDAAAIVEKLEEDKVEYQLQDNGTTILVPTELKYSTRLKLASENLPQGEVGFELFQQSNFGETQTDKNVKYREALQGELARTIQRLDKVQAAKVNIALPEQSLFQEEEELPKASVVVNTVDGERLTANEVKAIIHLVANSVERLDAENVVIVDQYGNLLSDNLNLSGDSAGTEVLQMQMELKRAYEREKQNAIQTMLDKTLGPDNSVVRVNAELDFNTVEESAEVYSHDPEGPFVRSESVTKESSTGTDAGTANVPGTDTNIPEYQQENNAGSASTYDKSEKVTNYEISKTETLTKYAPGDVRYDYLTVSVFVDNKVAQQANLGSTDEERADKIRNIVAAACGLRENRTNENVNLDENISVAFIDFYTEPEPEIPVPGGMEQIMTMPSLPFILGAAALVIMGIIFFLVRRKKQSEDVSESNFEAVVGEDISRKDLIEKKLTPEEQEKQRIRNEIDDLIDVNPEAAAQVVKAWLMEDQR